MAQIGYWLSSEEHAPNDLVDFARQAEATGFSFAMIADHFHPWVDQQGQSPFVWSVIGAIAATTSTLRLGTAVTCPIMRIHPAIIAQAAATSAALMPGRFFLGVGSGERLNEHILGDHWPPAAVRLEMLSEAITVIRQLWQGDMQRHRGTYFTVEDAQIYSLPAQLPPIYMAASGPHAIEMAAQQSDGLIGIAPSADSIERFDTAGGAGKPRYGQLKVCWAESEAVARRMAYKYWPNAGLKGALSTELALPKHFEQAVELVEEDDVAEAIICSPDPERHRAAIRAFIDAGFDHVCVHQIGPDQAGFFDFYQREVLPQV